MARSRLLLLVLTLLLALPPGLFAGQDVIVPSMATAPGLAAPQEGAVGSAGPALDARNRGERKAKRRHSRKAERKKDRDRKEQRQDRRERKKRGQSPEQARIAELVEAAPPRIPALAEGDDPCGPGLIQLRKSGRCTHGPDAPPPAEVLASDLDTSTSTEGRRGAANVPCDADGESGFRVQVLYVRSSSDPDNYAATLGDVRGYAASANAILRESSIAAGKELNFTYVMTGDCQIDVQDVVVSPSALRSFDATIIALDQQGYERTDRIYLMFADTNSAGYCGIGTLWGDDSSDFRNYNNRGPSYSRVDRNSGCWSGYTAAHELMHNLGAVQYSAPNSSKYGHCIDEYDVMCYQDAPGVQMHVQDACEDYDRYEFQFDCGNDDYFDPVPDAGSYLNSHWNTADNWFLTRDIPNEADITRPEVTWQAPTANGQTYVAGFGTIPLQVDAFDAYGVAFVDFWLYDAVADDWRFLGEDAQAPYTSSVNVSALRSGLNYVTADAFDTQGNRADEEIWLERSGGAEPTISLVTSTTRTQAKKSVRLTATVANPPASGTSVEFRVCRGGSCTWESARSLGVFTGPTSSTTWKASGKGQVTFLAQATGSGGKMTSTPTTVSVKKAKKKR